MPGGTRPFGTAHEAVVRARPVAHLPGTLSHHTARRAWEPPHPRSEPPTVALVSTAVVTGSYFIPVRRGAGYRGGGGGGVLLS